MKLIAYKIGEDHMDIHPASHERDWMDQTIHRYAYRCLPLQIANANGWVMECPSDITVCWTGGEHKDTLSIHFAERKWEFAMSSFGHGIITFHPGLLFRTISQQSLTCVEPGSGASSRRIQEAEPLYDLLVTGLPNYWYDFMVPLTGIVETWWSDATFTMNWKIIKPGTFEIKKGQPLIFITPIPHKIPDIIPELTNIRDDLEVCQKFNTWKKGRDKTIKALDHMSKTGEGIDGIDPTNPSTHWEKNYMRGITTGGEKQEEHHTKRRLPYFVEVTNGENKESG